MGYYANKQKMVSSIKNTLMKAGKKQVNVENLAYVFLEQYGFSESLVLQVLRKMERQGFITLLANETLIEVNVDGKAAEDKKEDLHGESGNSEEDIDRDADAALQRIVGEDKTSERG